MVAGILGLGVGVVVGRQRASQRDCGAVRGGVVDVEPGTVVVVVTEVESWSLMKRQVCARGGLRRGCGGLERESVWASPMRWSMKVKKVERGLEPEEACRRRSVQAGAGLSLSGAVYYDPGLIHGSGARE